MANVNEEFDAMDELSIGDLQDVESEAAEQPAPSEQVLEVPTLDEPQGGVAVENVVAPTPAEQPVAPVQTTEQPRPQPVCEAPKPAVVRAMPLPDYNTRLMRKERSGYAGTFRLAEGEEVLSMYRALAGKGVGGRVYLTNRRFLMEASLHTELPVDKVAGYSTGRFTHLSVFKLIFGILFLLVCGGVAAAFTLPNLLGNWSVFEDMSWLRYVFYAVGGLLGLVGLIMVCTSVDSRFMLSIITDGLQQAVSVRSGVGKNDVNIFQPIAYGNKGKDYKLFCREFGARLDEIKRALK